MTSGQDNQPREQRDEVIDHTRLQLSALLDGALAPDQARFLLRRLQHDDELAGCWSRWQLCGDVLRGQAGAALPADFAPRVAAAIAADAAASPATRPLPRWARWGSGAALAASVAVVALFVARQSPDAAPDAAPTQIAAAATTVLQPRQQTPLPAPAAPDTTAQLAALVAVAEVPRRAAARRSRAQSQRAAIRTPARRSVEPQLMVAVATPTPAVNNGAGVNPFTPRPTTITTRPWPRALLPNAAASGAFYVDYGSVDYGSSTLASPSLYPFQPRSMPGNVARPAVAETATASDDAPPAPAPR